MGLFNIFKRIRGADIEKEISAPIQEAECPSPPPSPSREENRKAYLEHQDYLFAKIIEDLPRGSILLSNDKVTKRRSGDMPEIKYSSITPKTSVERIGNYTVVDLETSGLSAVKNEIIEVSAMRFRDFRPVALFDSFVLPKKALPANITEITGIDEDMLKGAPEFFRLIPSLDEFIGADNLVGHNIEFDLKFLYVNGANICSIKRKYYDTKTLAQKKLKKPKGKWDKEYGLYEIDYESDYDVMDHKLETLCDFYSIRQSQSHRSSADCLCTGLLFNNIVSDTVDANIGCISINALS